MEAANACMQKDIKFLAEGNNVLRSNTVHFAIFRIDYLVIMIL